MLCLLLSAALILLPGVLADPPSPPLGQRWALNPEYSDEFDGNALNSTKWNNYMYKWEGRPPARFQPESVTVSDGMLKITAAKLPEPIQGRDGLYTMAGGAVQSVGNDAYFGYYETRVRANKLMMSTTFWLSTPQVIHFPGDECKNDYYKLEFDIIEQVGALKGRSKKMKANSHYVYRACNATTKQRFTRPVSARIRGKPVWEEFHVFGGWWVDENVGKFYADNELKITTEFRETSISPKPFDSPMRVNMVMETYFWAKPWPSDEELADTTINTSYYDWVRAWILVDADSNAGAESLPGIFPNEGVDFVGIDESQEISLTYEIDLLWKTNEERQVRLVLSDTDDNLVKESVTSVLAGYGKKTFSLILDTLPDAGSYNLKVQLLPLEGGETISQTSQDIEIA